MYPELIKIGDFSISSFGVMVALGFLTSYWLALLEFRRKGFDEKILGNFFIAAMVGGVIGAKLLFIFENVKEKRSTARRATTSWPRASALGQDV